MSVRDHLQEIYDRRGVLTPALVVDVARDPGHPLHHRFEWDDTVAAEEYRRVQAGDLIRSVTIKVESGRGAPTTVRAFLPVRQIATQPAEYVPAEVALADPMKRSLVLAEFKRTLIGVRTRFSALAEYAEYVQGYLLDGQGPP